MLGDHCKLQLIAEKLKNAESAARRAQARLDDYIASVLRDAVVGALTSDWRNTHSTIATGKELLSKLSRIRGSGTSPRRKSSIPTHEHLDSGNLFAGNNLPLEPEVSAFPVLPSSWTWATLGTIADVGTGISVSRNRLVSDPIELPYLRVANVMRGYLDLAEIKRIRVEKDQAHKYLLRVNDILFNEGGDRDKLGRGWIWEGQLPQCIHQNHVFRARLIDTALLRPQLISHWGNTFGQRYFVENGKQTTNLASINRNVLLNLPVPIAPVEEQTEILRRINHRLQSGDRLRATIRQKLEQTGKTRQSLLRDAFAGHFASQNSKDEPASVLLQKMQRRREEHTVNRKVQLWANLIVQFPAGFYWMFFVAAQSQ